MGARRAAVAGEAVVGPWPPAETDAARRQAPTGRGQGAGVRPAETGLAHDCMARGRSRTARSRFARLRVRAAHRDEWRAELRAEEWLLIEWPKGESEPTKYWLSTLPQNIAFADLVDFAKLRWRIERDYQELKQEVG